MKVLIISDIHGNWPALQAVVNCARHWDGIVCLGDIVNYGPHPAECVEWVRNNVQPERIVQGNHDRAVGLGIDPRCSLAYRPLAAAMQRFTEGCLSEEQKEWLGRLPERREFTLEGARFVILHAVPSEPYYGYVDRDDIGRWEDEVVFAGHPDFLLVGHTHQPFIRQVRDTVIINPGSVGQPKHGDPEASFAVWDGVVANLATVPYPVKEVVRDLKGCTDEETARQLGEILRSGGKFKPSQP